MKKVKIKRLEIEGFRALDLDLSFSEKTIIEAPNMFGKSRIMDAILWVLTLADKSNRSNFELFDNRKERNQKTDAPISVYVKLDVDGVDYELKRTAKVGWKKVSGTTEYVRSSGDSYDFKIDNISYAKNKYKTFIEANILDIEVLKIIMNNGYFFSLDNKEQKKYLNQLMPETPIEEISKDYPELKEFLEKQPYDDIKATLKKSLKPYKEKAEKYQNQISGIKSVLGTDIDVSDSKIKIEEIDSRIKKVDAEIENIQNENLSKFDEQSKFVESLNKMKSDARCEKDKFDEKQRETVRNIEKEISVVEIENEKIDSKIELRESRLKNLEEKNDYAKGLIRDYEKKASELRNSYTLVSSLDIDQTCPTCGGKVPEDSELYKNSKEEKEKKLTQIIERGKDFVNKIESNKKEIAKLETTKEEFLKSKIADKKDLLQLKENLNKAKENIVSYKDTESCKENVKRIKDYETQNIKVEKIDITELNKKRSDLLKQKEFYSKDVVLKEKQDKEKKSIKELQELQQNNAEQASKFERLIDMFTAMDRKKSLLIQHNIQDKFRICKVQVLKEQKDGHFADVCNITVNGVEPKLMSNSERTEASIDVSETFMEAYDISLPLVIDDAEKFTRKVIFKSDAQRIFLVAKPKFEVKK